MKHRCPKCGHRFEDNKQQSKAAKARWKATSAEDRSTAASAAALARWKNNKAAPGPSNVADEPRRLGAVGSGRLLGPAGGKARDNSKREKTHK